VGTELDYTIYLFRYLFKTNILIFSLIRAILDVHIDFLRRTETREGRKEIAAYVIACSVYCKTFCGTLKVEPSN